MIFLIYIHILIIKRYIYESNVYNLVILKKEINHFLFKTNKQFIYIVIILIFIFIINIYINIIYINIATCYK